MEEEREEEGAEENLLATSKRRWTSSRGIRSVKSSNERGEHGMSSEIQD